MRKIIRRTSQLIFWLLLAAYFFVQEVTFVSGSKRVILLYVAQSVIRHLAAKLFKPLAKPIPQQEHPDMLAQ